MKYYKKSPNIADIHLQGRVILYISKSPSGNLMFIQEYSLWNALQGL